MTSSDETALRPGAIDEVAASVRATYHAAAVAEDHALAEGLIAWLMGQPNVSADIKRMANLLQVSSAYGRAMESVDRLAMSVALYPTLRRLVADPGRPRRA